MESLTGIKRHKVRVDTTVNYMYNVAIIHVKLHEGAYSCFEKGCPTEKHKSVRDNTERPDGLWLFTVVSSNSRVFTAMEGRAMNTCLRVLKETK